MKNKRIFKRVLTLFCVILAVLILIAASLISLFFIMKARGRHELSTPGLKPNLPSFSFDEEFHTTESGALNDSPSSANDGEAGGKESGTSGEAGGNNLGDASETSGKNSDTTTSKPAYPSNPGSTSSAKTENTAPATSFNPGSNLPQNADAYYKGKAYNYKSNLINILMIGVDRNSDQDAQNQADSLYLVVIDDDSKKIEVIAISRNTVSTVSQYDINGKFFSKAKTQICLAYGFGKNDKQSSELTVESVSSLFYGLPIQGYYTVFMDEMEDIVKSVGGVEVIVTKDVEGLFEGWKTGDKVNLDEKNILKYLQNRDMTVAGSNETRVERHKSFIMSFFTKAKASFKANPSLPLNLYNTLSNRSVTNISANSAVYLATAVFESGIRNIKTLSGKIGSLNGYDSFEVDEKAFYELILNIFYKEIS